MRERDQESGGSGGPGLVEVHIDHIDARGRGVGSLAVDGRDPRSVLVPGAWPGERVVARVRRRGRPDRPALAELVEVRSRHPGRRPAPCARHESHDEGRCSGCPLMTLDDEAQRELRLELARAAGLDPAGMTHDAALGYRWSAKRVVGGRPGALVLGSYVAGSHRLADMHGCLVDHPTIVACVTELTRVSNELEIEPYDERTGRGDLRYVWLKTDGEGVLLTLITAAAESRAAEELPSRLGRPAGVAHSVQAGKGNAVRGARVLTLAGAPGLTLSLDGEAVEIGPLGFLQPNPGVAALAYRALVDGPAPSPGDLALDLYAGAGLTTRLLSRRFARVEACEQHPESARSLGTEALDAATFLAARARAGSRPDLVVANPPRRGMGPEVCEHLRDLAPGRIHLMSCSPRSLADDLARLVEAGYRVERVQAFDTLPQTAHVELVAWLSRSEARSGGSQTDATP